MDDVGREIIDAPSREDMWKAAVQVIGELQAKRWMKTSHPKLEGKAPTSSSRKIPGEFMSLCHRWVLEQANS